MVKVKLYILYLFCGAFILVFIGAYNVKINHEIQEFILKKKLARFTFLFRSIASM